MDYWYPWLTLAMLFTIPYYPWIITVPWISYGFYALMLNPGRTKSFSVAHRRGTIRLRSQYFTSATVQHLVDCISYVGKSFKRTRVDTPATVIHYANQQLFYQVDPLLEYEPRKGSYWDEFANALLWICSVWGRKVKERQVRDRTCIPILKNHYIKTNRQVLWPNRELLNECSWSALVKKTTKSPTR